MVSMASITVVGNLGRDAETRYTASGEMVVTFSVAVTVRGDNDELTNWYQVNTWGRLAEALDTLCQKGMFRKGDAVTVLGRLALKTWRSHDGREGQSLTIRADQVIAHTVRSDGEPNF